MRGWVLIIEIRLDQSIMARTPLGLNRIRKGGEYQSNVSGPRPTCWGFKKSTYFGLINCHKLGDLTVMQLSHENV